MPSQEEFLISLVESSAVVAQDNFLVHGARILRERLRQDFYDHAQLLNAEAHEAAIIQQQRLRPSRSLPTILELHELGEIAESVSLGAENEDYQVSESDELVFSKEEVQNCMALAHARSGRDSAIDIEDEEEPSYVMALAAIIDAAPVGELRPGYHYFVPPPQRDPPEENEDENLNPDTTMVASSGVEKDSSASTQSSGDGNDLQLRFRIQDTSNVSTGLANRVC